MRQPDIEKLLGGYATGTLTPEERAALLEAALSNQPLFDALADEEALRELLADAGARAELLEALRPAAAARPRGIFAWVWARPVAAALAACLGIAVFAAGVLLYRPAEQREVAVAMRQTPEAQARDQGAGPEPAPVNQRLSGPAPFDSSPRPAAGAKPPQPASRLKQERKDAKVQAAGERDDTAPAGPRLEPRPVLAGADRAAPVGGGRPAEEPLPLRQLAPARDQVEQRREGAVPAAGGGEKKVPKEAAPHQAAAALAEHETPAAAEQARAAPPPPRAGRAALAAPAVPGFEWTLLRRDESGEYRATEAREFRAGETLRLRVVARADGHLYVTGPAGRPVRYRSVRAGEPAEIPLTGDAGVTRFRIVLSDAPLTGLQTRALAGLSAAGAPSKTEPAAAEIELTFR